MIRIALGLALAGAVVSAAPAAKRQLSDEARLAERLAGRVAGPPQDCIDPSPSEAGGNYGNTVLLKGRSGILYRTHFEGGCTVSSWDVQVSRRPTTRLCRGDIIEIRDQTSGIVRGACSYAEFVPYSRR